MIALCRAYPRVLLLATDGGLFRSADGGDHWAKLSGAIEQFHPRVMHMQFDPHRGPRDQPHLYIGTQGRGLFRYLPPQ